MTTRLSFWPGLLTTCLVIGMPDAVVAAPVTTAPPPVTSGLFVRINGNNLPTDTQGAFLDRWVDQATDGSPGTHQDFIGGTTVAGNINDPRIEVGHTMPNGLTATIVNFNRGTISSTQNRSSTTNSQYMRSVLGGSDSDTTAGSDPAYQLGQLTYFTVFRTYVASVPSTTVHNQALQTIIQSDHDPLETFVGSWNTSTTWAGVDNTGAAVAENTTPDLYNGLRDSGGNQDSRGVPDIVGGNSPEQWYIAATSWNVTSGNVRMLFRDQLGSVVDSSFVQASPQASGLSAHLQTWLGTGRIPTTNGQALNGDIAEVLIYNTALSTGDMDSVMSYLNSKYFVAAPPHAGDFDLDGDVDGADFVAWQTNFPKATGAVLAEGDADADGDVDGADFVVWQTNFPFTPGPGAVPVPEPSAAILAIFGGLLAWRRRNSHATTR